MGDMSIFVMLGRGISEILPLLAQYELLIFTIAGADGFRSRAFNRQFPVSNGMIFAATLNQPVSLGTVSTRTATASLTRGHLLQHLWSSFNSRSSDPEPERGYSLNFKRHRDEACFHDNLARTNSNLPLCHKCFAISGDKGPMRSEV